MSAPLTHHRTLRVTWLGKEVPYAEGMAVMRRAMDEVAEGAEGELLLLEHAPVITVTRQGGLAHLLCRPEVLSGDGIELVETDRGGDVTFHGPGQLVGYPIVRLHRDEEGRANLLRYLRALEAGLLEACFALGVRGAHRKEGMTGVWVASDPDAPAETWEADVRAKKLVAIGVGVRRGVTRHGFAFNLDIDHSRYTRRIVPCGLHGRGVISLAELLPEGHIPSEETVRQVVARSLARAFGLELSSPGVGASTPVHTQEDGALYG